MYEIRRIVIPSVVGVGNTDMGMLTLGGALGKRRRARPYRISWGRGLPYLVGPAVEFYTRPQDAYLSIERLADGQDTRALTYAALGAALNGHAEVRARVVVGLPVQALRRRAEAKDLVRRIRRWMVGRHAFRYASPSDAHEQRRIVEVVEMKVLPQPVGAYFAWALAEDGTAGRPARDLRRAVGIVDVGFNTVDVFAVQEGQVLKEHTAGESIGVRAATRTLQEFIQERFGVRITHHRAAALLMEKRPLFAARGREEDLMPVVRQALEAAGRDVAAFIENTWAQGDAFHTVLVVGGGARLFWPQIRKRLPWATLLADPVLANAEGLARYARRTWPEEPAVVGLDPGFGNYKVVLHERVPEPVAEA